MSAEKRRSQRVRIGLITKRRNSATKYSAIKNKAEEEKSDLQKQT